MNGPLFADIQRYSRGGCCKSRISALRIVLLNYGLHALVAYRLGRLLLRTRRSFYWWPLWMLAWPVYFILSSYVRVVYDIRLFLSADIGPGLHISHFGGIFVRNCRLGARCSIAQLVQICPSDGEAGPLIGDRVWIGAHCKIKGRFRIGSGSTLGAGCIVQRDIPEKALCLGAPARIIMPGYDNQRIL